MITKAEYMAVRETTLGNVIAIRNDISKQLEVFKFQWGDITYVKFVISSTFKDINVHEYFPKEIRMNRTSILSINTEVLSDGSGNEVTARIDTQIAGISKARAEVRKYFMQMYDDALVKYLSDEGKVTFNIAAADCEPDVLGRPKSYIQSFNQQELSLFTDELKEAGWEVDITEYCAASNVYPHISSCTFTLS